MSHDEKQPLIELRGISKSFGQVEALKKLNTESIPEAQNAFEIIRDGNLVGRFTILDVLDTQRTLFELQSEYLRTLGNYNIQLVQLERLIGQNIESIK